MQCIGLVPRKSSFYFFKDPVKAYDWQFQTVKHIFDGRINRSYAVSDHIPANSQREGNQERMLGIKKEIQFTTNKMHSITLGTSDQGPKDAKIIWCKQPSTKSQMRSTMQC